VFLYYGGKRRLAEVYPPPSYDTIIEPFAGGAGYAMYHLRSVRRVILVEKDERVVDTWERLLAMSRAELVAFPTPVAGDDTSDFLVMTSAQSNAIAGCKRMTVTPRMPQAFEQMRRGMLAVLEEAQAKVEIHCGDYTSAPDLEATWFIDPPYQVEGSNGTPLSRGRGYRRGSNATTLDYGALGEWCQQRQGQRIVCEHGDARWLPFRHIGRSSQDSQGVATSEVAWIDPPYQLAAF
jgi:site-specific DNA-adenine methylase